MPIKELFNSNMIHAETEQYLLLYLGGNPFSMRYKTGLHGELIIKWQSEMWVALSKTKRKSITSRCNSMCKVPGFRQGMVLNEGIFLKPSMARDWKKSPGWWTID